MLENSVARPDPARPSPGTAPKPPISSPTAAKSVSSCAAHANSQEKASAPTIVLPPETH